MSSSGIPASTQARNTLIQECGNIRNNVIVLGILLHGARFALHVHQANRNLEVGSGLQRTVTSQRVDIVNHCGACRDGLRA